MPHRLLLRPFCRFTLYPSRRRKVSQTSRHPSVILGMCKNLAVRSHPCARTCAPSLIVDDNILCRPRFTHIQVNLRGPRWSCLLERNSAGGCELRWRFPRDPKCAVVCKAAGGKTTMSGNQLRVATTRRRHTCTCLGKDTGQHERGREMICHGTVAHPAHRPYIGPSGSPFALQS